jgi:hypothetical protein
MTVSGAEPMDRIQWTGAFAPSDATLREYASFVEALPTW